MESLIQFSPHKQQAQHHQQHLGATTPTNPLSTLNDDARLLNGGILGRHSVKCNFSTRLTGRFYNDGSLERATFRKSRLVEMQGRKRRLEKEYQLEERRVNVLEERLIETEQARDDAHEMIVTIERGLVQFQTCIRQRQALKLLRDMQYELYMKQLVAQFFQCHYRGWRGRLEVKARQNELKRKRRNTSAAYIQASYRRFSQRRYYLDLLSERQRISNQSAACIQSMLRMKITREMYQLETKKRQGGAQTLQRVWRGIVGRLFADKIRQDLLRAKREAEKPKRIPLHMRRYSTYGSSASSNANNNSQQRRGIPNNSNTGGGSTKKRDARTRRRSSDAMIITQGIGRLSSLANFQQSSSSSSSIGNCVSDENDSVGSALTFQTNASFDLPFRRRRRRPTEKQWPSPQRVINSHRRATTLQQQQQSSNNSKIMRRSSLERRKTVSGGGTSLSSTSSSTTVPQHHTNESSLDEQKGRSPLTLLQTTCNSNDNSSTDESGSSSDESTSSSDYSSGNDAIDRIAAAAEEGKIPISSSEETVSLLVQEMIGKTELCHDMHSFPVFSENEDDLQ